MSCPLTTPPARPGPTRRSRARGHALARAVLALAALVAAVPHAHAQRSDRGKPIVIEADRPGVLDFQRQVLVFSGNAVVTQGSMVLRADRIEMREMADGYRAAIAIGVPGKPATWRQKREGAADETVEGSAERIEFDGRADTLRFSGASAVRRLRGGAVADEITGAEIVWDNVAEVFRVAGGETSAANPGGRVRVILAPRAAEPASAPAAPTPLQPSRSLPERPR